jgi:hypothetical protein
MNSIPSLVVAASLALAACAPPAIDDRPGTAEQASLSVNALTHNALTHNALSANALSANALTHNALSANALSANALVATALQDPEAQQLFSYIVSCALPADASVEVTIGGADQSFPGGLGLAPEWGEEGGQCDQRCQAWVSACLLARVDYLGVHKEISLRGDHPALAVSAEEAADYTVREATYYGNVFTAPEPQRRHACLSPGQTEITRVCGPTLEGCVVEVDASCDEVCGAPRADGAFPNCRPGDGDRDDHPDHASITVFLRPGE